MITEHTNSVSLVHHDGTIIFMLQLHNLRQLCQITLHREYAIYYYQLDSLLRQLLKHTLQIVHIVVLIMQLTGKRKTTTVHNRSVVTIVTDNIVVLADNHCQHTLIYRETGREAKAVILVDKLGDFLLQSNMQVQCTIQESASGTSGTILVQCSLCGVNNALITGQASIGV